MSQKFTLAIVAIAFGSGVIFGRVWSAKTEVGEARGEDYRAKFHQLKNKLDELHSLDVEEYLRLKDQKAKFEKAEEIMGKMILIFLADLGLKLSTGKQQLAELMASGKTGAVVSESVATTLPVSQPVLPMRSIGEPSSTVGKVDPMKLKEKKFDEASSEDQAKKILDDVVLADLYGSMRSARPIDLGQLQAVNGFFAGKVVFDDKNKTEVWDVEMTIQGSVKDGEPYGKSNVKIYKSGEDEPFSNSNSDGNFKDFNGLNGSEAILISVRGGGGVFQLYAPKKLNILVGNYYEKQGAGSFVKSGTVTLQKR